MSVIVKQYSDQDKELLRKELPDNPCNKCSYVERISCTGCYLKSDYDSAVAPYKDAGIYDEALKVKEKTKLKREIKKMHEMVRCIDQYLPDFLQESK